MTRASQTFAALSGLIFVGGCTTLLGIDGEYRESPGAMCQNASDCAGPPDKRCGVATCDNGECGLSMFVGQIASQRMGDCKVSVCDAKGNVIEKSDPLDAYDDGKECTFDRCDPNPVNEELIGITCPMSGDGICHKGTCVSCVTYQDCSGNQLCVFDGRCVANTCANVTTDSTETDQDCGNDCLPCNVGMDCLNDSDCRHNVCTDGKCAAPTCDDLTRNNDETDIDCGVACPGQLCANGKSCEIEADCLSGVCWAGKCQAPRCTDGVQNGDEIGLDCGGSCFEC